mmetsp:Transcript_25398/g.70141  ORF Transcript_25398/g.70141 Transcript_25398/m.70141 type:complete len:220 (+) Transcript_25398:842-1501(+)
MPRRRPHRHRKKIATTRRTRHGLTKKKRKKEMSATVRCRHHQHPKKVSTRPLSATTRRTHLRKIIRRRPPRIRSEARPKMPNLLRASTRQSPCPLPRWRSDEVEAGKKLTVLLRTSKRRPLPKTFERVEDIRSGSRTRTFPSSLGQEAPTPESSKRLLAWNLSQQTNPSWTEKTCVPLRSRANPPPWKSVSPSLRSALVEPTLPRRPTKQRKNPKSYGS